MNERSAMVEVNRLVKYRFKDFKSLLTLPNTPMYISDLFIASVKVSILVVLVTAQLKASGTLKGESSTGCDQHLVQFFSHFLVP